MTRGLQPQKQQKKALQRTEQARASAKKAQGRVDGLRARLARAEEKLTRRVARLSAAEASYTALAAPPAPAQDVELIIAEEIVTPAPTRARKNGAAARKSTALPQGTPAAGKANTTPGHSDTDIAP